MEALRRAAPWDWLIVDHYALDRRWESALRGVARQVMVIDDLADRPHDCDLLLDQNCFETPRRRYESLVDEDCRLLLGPGYALLRPEFRSARAFTRMRGNGVARVLVYFGGSDTGNAAGKAVEALCAPAFRHLLVDVVAGPYCPHLDALRAQAAGRPGTRVHVQPDGFVELLLRSDLCIGAGGSSVWERMCLGLPSLVVSVAENQVESCRELAKRNLIVYLGPLPDTTSRKIENALGSLIGSGTDLDRVGRAGKAMVDAHGATRIRRFLFP